MAHKLEFEDLLQSASPDDVDKLEKALDELKAEEEAIQERLYAGSRSPQWTSQLLMFWATGVFTKRR